MKKQTRKKPKRIKDGECGIVFKHSKRGEHAVKFASHALMVEFLEDVLYYHYHEIDTMEVYPAYHFAKVTK